MSVSTVPLNSLEKRSSLASQLRQTQGVDMFQDQEFEPLVILEFDPKTTQAAQEWLTAKLQAPRIDNGAELLVRTNCMDQYQETILYLGASLDRLLIGAEEMSMQKRYKDGSLHDISLTDLFNFVNGDDLSNFLTKAEKQRVIMKAIESVRASEEETYIPGYPKYLLYPGKSIIKKYLSRQIVTNLYPLHEDEALKRLGSEWYSLKNYFRPQPIDKIQEYFGVKIAIYFSFLGVYTISLIPPAILGVIYFMYPWCSVYREATFAVFNLIWSTVFLEGWKRYCNSQCYKWGTIDSSLNFAKSFEEPRADYYGKIGRNLITGHPEPVYPKWKRVLKFYMVTVPVITFCLSVAFFVMLAYFWAEQWMKKHAPKDLGIITTFNSFLPTIGYAVCIGILNNIYRGVAVKLNKYENHRLESSYENHLILKLILFDFVNCFICLFYVAFYLRDRDLLKTFLGTLLVTQQILGQFQESMIPFFFMQRRQKQMDEALKKTQQSAVTKQNDGGSYDVDQVYKKQAALEGLMDKWTGSNAEYLELYIQFGYVYLFSSAFPLAPLWALINNVIEIRSDSFKFCRVFQRPFTETASSIGAWQQAFEVIGLISVVTNCALIGMDPEVQKLLPSDISPVNMVLLFVVAEHIVLAIKAGVALLIPDIPNWVTLQMAKHEFSAKQALRKQMREESRNGKFKMIDRIMEAAQKKKVLMEAFRNRQAGRHSAGDVPGTKGQ